MISVAIVTDKNDTVTELMHRNQQPLSVITTSEESSITSDESEQEDTHYNSTKPICGDCGRELSKGWECSDCRKQCPLCNRSLLNEPKEYCERCYANCQYHGLYEKAHECKQCNK